MSENERSAGEDNWSCSNCGAPQPVEAGVRFHRCDACGALFKLAWRSGRLDTAAIKLLPPDSVDQMIDPDLLVRDIQSRREQLRVLADRIRALEMSKGSERLGLLAVFLLICAAIYVLFQITVVGWETLLNPGVVELGIAAMVILAVLVLIVLRTIRAAVIRRVQQLQHDYDEQERSIESGEATLALRGYQPPEHPAARHAPEPEPEESPSDIIEKFATRQRERRSRLGLRNRSEDED
jgi:hypothetical protein